MTHSTFPLRRGHTAAQPQFAFLNRLLFWGEPLVVLLCALPITLPNRLLPGQWQAIVVITLYLLLWGHRLWHRRPSTAFQLDQQATGLLLLWLPLAVAMAPNSAHAWQAAGYLLLGLAFYQVIVTQEQLRSGPADLRWVCCGLGVVLTGIAPVVVNWKSEFRLFYVPLYDFFTMFSLNIGETIHANVLAGALVLLIALLIPQLLPGQEQIHKIHVVTAEDGHRTLRLQPHRHSWQWLTTGLLICLAVSMVGIMLLTQSRGGYLALFLVLGVILLLRWPRLLWSVPLLLGAITYGSYTVGGSHLFTLLGADNTFGGADWRGPVWHASWQAFQDFAWTGIGIGNFQQVLPLLYPNPAITNPAATHAHNLLLQIGLDLGLPGLAAYLTLYVIMIGMTLVVLRRTHSRQSTATVLGATWNGHTLNAPPEVGVTISTKRFIRHLIQQERTRQQHWAIAAGCLAALLGLQVHGLLDAVTWGNKLAFVPWLIFAQITLLYRYHTEQTADSVKSP